MQTRCTRPGTTLQSSPTMSLCRWNAFYIGILHVVCVGRMRSLCRIRSPCRMRSLCRVCVGGKRSLCRIRSPCRMRSPCRKMRPVYSVLQNQERKVKKKNASSEQNHIKPRGHLPRQCVSRMCSNSCLRPQTLTRLGVDLANLI